MGKTIKQCDGCTACCYAFYVKHLNKPPNTICKHCNNGCEIHDNLHYECSSFNCSYIQSNVDNDKLRPDKCGVIFEMLENNTFLATLVKGTKVTDIAKKQMQSLKDQGYKVMINGNL